MQPTLFTIGHGAREFGDFLETVTARNIRTVIDVRSVPYSSHQPEYAKQVLSEELTTSGISYRWLGDHLGGLPIRHGENAPILDPDLLEAGMTDAAALAEGTTSALLCSEAEPNRCHRLSVLAPLFGAAGFVVMHIRPDGSLLPHQPSLDL